MCFPFAIASSLDHHIYDQTDVITRNLAKYLLRHNPPGLLMPVAGKGWIKKSKDRVIHTYSPCT